MPDPDHAAIRLALTTIPPACRFHGTNLNPTSPTREACCDTGKPALRRRAALEALARLERDTQAPPPATEPETAPETAARIPSLTEFLTARLDEDEAAAKGLLNAARELGKKPNFYGAGGPAAEAYWDRFNLTRILADVAVMRAVIHVAGRSHDYHEVFLNGFAARMEKVLRLLAQSYSDHPHYRTEW
jgi:hypothetical protein